MSTPKRLQELESLRPSVEGPQGWVDVRDEPRHYHRFENDYVRVYDVQFPPGEGSLVHRHTKDTMYTTIYDTLVYDHTFGEPEGKVIPLTSGLCGCRPHGTEPLTHSVLNKGQSLMHMIGAEHKRTPPVVANQVLQAPYHEPVEDPFHGEVIRIYRIRLNPGQSTGEITYPFFGLTVSLTDSNVQFQSPGESARVISFSPGAHLWHEGPITQTLTNVGETAFVALLGEWR